MDEKQITIAQAAIRVISRYGLRKTTMNDLAQEAGVSRQTLYNAYASKEEVIRDAIRFETGRTIAQVSAAWDRDQTLDAQLDSFFAHGPVAWFDLIQSSPDAADLLDGLNTAGHAELAEGTARWTHALAELLRGHDFDFDAIGQSAEDLADFIYSTSSSAKYSAQSRAQLLSRLATLKAAVLALVRQD